MHTFQFFFIFQEVKCKDVEQETCANVPTLSEAAVASRVSWPEPETRCADKTLEVTRLLCDTFTIDKCITVPDIVTEQQTSQVTDNHHHVLDLISCCHLRSVDLCCHSQIVEMRH